jgi:AcrR family transcriptional regulator
MIKQDIIRAAFRIWGRELYQTTSLTQVARELGVTKPALYRHFKNKQTLLDAMYEDFFDDYAASIKAAYDRAIAVADPKEGLFIMIRAIVSYYSRGRDAFIFSLIMVYGNRERKNPAEQLLARGIDMRKLGPLGGTEEPYPSTIQLVIATATFWVACFHRYDYTGDNPPEEAVLETVSFVEEKIFRGLGFDHSLVGAINYRELEDRVGKIPLEPSQEDRIFRAAAGTIAEMGPWKASMDRIARRSGLSKGGLYAHFKSKRDLLRRIFGVEFDRMAVYMEEGIKNSEVPEEQFYLAIAAIANYLRFKPKILIAVDWFRTRRFDLEPLVPLRLYQVFSNIKIPGLEPMPERVSQWVLFLIVNTLMRWPWARSAESRSGENREGPSGQSWGSVFSGVEYTCLRILYKFVTLGIQV